MVIVDEGAGVGDKENNLIRGSSSPTFGKNDGASTFKGFSFRKIGFILSKGLPGDLPPVSFVSVAILHFPKFDTRILILVGNLSDASCSLLDCRLNVEFLFFCKCNSNCHTRCLAVRAALLIWRLLASLQILQGALRRS